MKKLDNYYCVQTPEAVELRIQPAGFWSRGLAFATDFSIRILVYSLIASLGSVFFASFSVGVNLILYFLMEWFYPVFFEVWNNGATPGKRMLNIRVVHEDSTPVNFSASVIRNLLRVVDFLPIFYVFGIISSLSNRSFQRLGDIAAGTLVINNQFKYVTPSLTAKGVRALPDGFTLEDQNAVLAFAERGAQLSEERSAELAQILVPTLQAQESATSASNPVASLHQMANGIVGLGP